MRPAWPFPRAALRCAVPDEHDVPAVSSRARTALAGAVTAGAVGAVAWWMRGAITLAGTWPQEGTADALPLYLGVQTLRRGGDPTTAAALAQTYASEKLSVVADTFSTLYPGTTSAILAPFVAPGWPTFAMAWHGVLLWSAVVAGAAGAMAGVPRARWPLAAALGALVATVGFPVALTCARLGQVNLLLAAGAGLVQLALSVGLGGLAGALLALGAGVKLVPLLAAWPLIAARHRRAFVGAVVTGAALLGWTALSLPLTRVFLGVWDTLGYQSNASRFVVAGLPPGAPEWMNALVALRHLPLGLLTVVIAARVGWSRRPGALVGGVALVYAWLAADASAQHLLYLPLGLASLAWVAVWPLAAGAPRWSVVGVLVALGAYATFGPDWFAGHPAQFRAVVVAEAVWLVTAARALHEAGPLARRDVVGLGAVVAVACALTLLPPSRPAPGPNGPPLSGAPPPGGPGDPQPWMRATTPPTHPRQAP